jgi:hypothetical protein
MSSQFEVSRTVSDRLMDTTAGLVVQVMELQRRYGSRSQHVVSNECFGECVIFHATSGVGNSSGCPGLLKMFSW